MSTPISYPGLKYSSPQQRVLAGITQESYQKVYDDQAALLSKIVGDISFISQDLRKVQSGVDQANENVIQQIQDFINNIGVLLGGGDNTGIDFGDLKYVFQAIGALFGFGDADGNLQVPVNLFEAAWNFMSNYVIPLDNWQELMNDSFDKGIALLVDSLGGIPIVGQAAEQLAQMLTQWRDNAQIFNDYMQQMWDNLSIQSQQQWNQFWEDFTTFWNGLVALFKPFTDPIMEALQPVFDTLATWNQEITDTLTQWGQSWNDFIYEIDQSMGGTSIDLSNSTQIIVDLFTILGQPPLGSGLQPSQWATDFINKVLAQTQAWNDWVSRAMNGIMNGDFSILFSGVPISVLTNQEQDLQINSGFDDLDSIAPNNLGWTRDPNEGYTKLGAAKVNADGKMHALQGNKVSVVANQQLNLSARCKYVGLAGTGTPLQLWVRFNNGQDVLVAYVNANSGTSAGWVHIYGSVTVPANATLAWTRIIVDKSATAGAIWWDDIPDKKGSTALPRSWVDQLDGMLDSIANLFNWPGAVELLGGDPTEAWEQAVDQFLGPLRVFVSFEFWDNLSTLWDTFFKFCFGQATQVQLTNAWNTVLGDFDVPPPPNMAAVIPNALNAWSVQIAQATVSGLTDINTWLRNIIEDATIVFGDGLHWTYALGSVSDSVDRIWTTPGIGYGKRTWYAAWNRLMQALGWAKSSSAPTVQPNDIGAKFVATDTAVGSAQATADGANTSTQAIADGINQAITGTTSTGSPKTAAAVKANLTAIPPKNITAQDYGVLAFQDQNFSIPANASIYLPPNKITQAQANGESIGASTTKGIWLAEPGLYAIQTICTFKASAGWSISGAITPTLVYGDAAPPSSGTWTGSHTLPCGTSSTIVDSNVTYCMVGTNNYVRTDEGNRYFLPGVLFTNGSSTAGTFSLGALAMIVVKLSN